MVRIGKAIVQVRSRRGKLEYTTIQIVHTQSGIVMLEENHREIKSLEETNVGGRSQFGEFRSVSAFVMMVNLKYYIMARKERSVITSVPSDNWDKSIAR